MPLKKSTNKSPHSPKSHINPSQIIITPTPPPKKKEFDREKTMINSHDTKNMKMIYPIPLSPPISFFTLSFSPHFIPTPFNPYLSYLYLNIGLNQFQTHIISKEYSYRNIVEIDLSISVDVHKFHNCEVLKILSSSRA